MKKLSLFLMLTAVTFGTLLTSCTPDVPDDPDKKEEKHTWTADTLIVNPSDSKYSAYSKILLAGDYTSDDFTIYARDSYYISGTHAEFDGYSDQWNKQVQSNTTFTVNGVEASDGKFTIESGKDYKIKFTYEGLSSEINATGNIEGGIVASTDSLAAIEGVIYGDVYPSDDNLSFKQVTIEHGTFSDSVYGKSVKIGKVTADNGYSVFIGADEKNLTKYDGTFYTDYKFNTTDKVVKIFHEDIASVSAAKTLPYTINLNISAIAVIANAEGYFNNVTKGTEVKLSELFNAKWISCYDEEGDSIGKLPFTDDDISSGKLKFEIYDNLDFTGDPVATIDSSSISAGTWTPDSGYALKKYTMIRKDTTVNGVITATKTYTVSSTSCYYFVKIIYDDGSGNAFTNSVKKETVKAGTDSDGTLIVLPEGETEITIPSDYTGIYVQSK